MARLSIFFFLATRGVRRRLVRFVLAANAHVSLVFPAPFFCYVPRSPVGPFLDRMSGGEKAFFSGLSTSYLLDSSFF